MKPCEHVNVKTNEMCFTTITKIEQHSNIHVKLGSTDIDKIRDVEPKIEVDALIYVFFSNVSQDESCDFEYMAERGQNRKMTTGIMITNSTNWGDSLSLISTS